MSSLNQPQPAQSQAQAPPQAQGPQMVRDLVLQSAPNTPQEDIVLSLLGEVETGDLMTCLTT